MIYTPRSEAAFVAYQEELFRVQVRILDLGTRQRATKGELQEALMQLRNEIISFRATQVIPQ